MTIPKEKRVVPLLHHRHIKGTCKGVIVQDVQAFLCNLTKIVSKDERLKVFLNTFRVYIKTRVLKHVYDKRIAQEYDFLINHLHKIIRYPDKIYENKNSKRGDFCFFKKIQGVEYICSIERVAETEEDKFKLEIATFFVLYKKNYLNNYKLLWSREDDNPPS